jgi:hypothetical protein
MIEYEDLNGDETEATCFCPNCGHPEDLAVLATVTFPVDPNSGALRGSSPNDCDTDDLDRNNTATCNRCEWSGPLHDCEVDYEKSLLATPGILNDIDKLLECLERATLDSGDTKAADRINQRLTLWFTELVRQ